MKWLLVEQSSLGFWLQWRFLFYCLLQLNENKLWDDVQVVLVCSFKYSLFGHTPCPSYRSERERALPGCCIENILENLRHGTQDHVPFVIISSMRWGQLWSQWRSISNVFELLVMLKLVLKRTYCILLPILTQCSLLIDFRGWDLVNGEAFVK